MRVAITAILFGLWALLLSSGCSGDGVYDPPPALANYQGGNQSRGVVQSDGGDFIYDRTGKAWDVSHSQEYGMEPSGFQYGLGPFSITPIMNPQMLSPGDPDYPSDNDDFIVLGASLDGFTRAYPINVMSWHEIANERFGDAHVAVGY